MNEARISRQYVVQMWSMQAAAATATKATMGSRPTRRLPETHNDHTTKSIKPLAVDLDQAFLGRHTAQTKLRQLGLMQQAARPCVPNTTEQDLLSCLLPAALTQGPTAPSALLPW
jgi:hypothetical protein